jgi:hypothetical protein
MDTPVDQQLRRQTVDISNPQVNNNSETMHPFSRLVGEFIGDYHVHGYEIIKLEYSREEIDSHTLIHKLVATKVTGDPNIPAGQITWRVEEVEDIGHGDTNGNSSSNNRFIVRSTGEGQIADYGYVNSVFIPGELVHYSDDYTCLVFVFHGIGPLFYLRREPGYLGSLYITADEELYTRHRLRAFTQTLSLGYNHGLYNPGGTSSASIQLIESNLKSVDNNNRGDMGTCTICLYEMNNNEYGDPVILKNCQHLYHRECIKKWLIRHNSCPLCKRKLTH